MMVGHAMDLTNEELMEMLREPHKFQSYLQQLLAEKKATEDFEEEIDWGTDDFFSGANPHYGFHESSSEATTALYSDKQMTKLYRQLAKQLHPQERHLSKYRDTLQQEVEELLQKCDEIRTVKQMQHHLKERVHAARFHQQLMNIEPSEFFAAEDNWF